MSKPLDNQHGRTVGVPGVKAVTEMLLGSVLGQLAGQALAEFARGRAAASSVVAMLGLSFLLLAYAAPAADFTTPSMQGQILTSGRCQLGISTNLAFGGVKIWLPAKAGPAADFQAMKSLMVELLDVSGATNWLSANYSSVVRVDGALRCGGLIRTANGTVFEFADTYRAGKQADTFMLEREVMVRSPDTDDVGFMTRFSLESSQPSPLREQEVFVPGVWYLDNQHVPARALAANPSDNRFLIREDRMALPLVMMRNKNNGTTITLTHCDPDGTTCLADYQSSRVVDGRIQVASLGLWSHENPAVSFCYPATEGERSYLRSRETGRSTDESKRWVERFHPVQTGVKHSYKIMIRLDVTPDFPTAMRQAWRAAYAEMPPPISQTDLAACYEASIKLISDWSQTYNGCAGIPFRLRLPQGELEDKQYINFQMGFVGQQLPLAYQLLRYGLLHHDEEILRKGEAMVDFWAANSLTEQGLPRVWYDVYPQPHWRPYNTFMRIASDGMVGALMSWDVMQAHGRPKPEWLRFCRGFGDWLVQYQNQDGSWYREYDWDSHPVNLGKQNTSHPIRFLVDLSKATGEKKYLDAALRAGDYCYANIHQKFVYVGGTPDNPNVIDKEAGILAMEAFLALHDLTGEKRWLEAAAQAGDFTETWLYCWNIPLPAEDRAVTYPSGCTTTGFSLIATGHSASDLFLAATPFLYYRLYLETGDAHYADIARQQLYNTKEAVDINGSLGYGHPGLCTEALYLAPPRGHGVNVWLPWLTWSMIDPLVKLRDAYGMMDIPPNGTTKLVELREKDAEYARTRGLWSAQRGGQNPAH